MGITFHDRVLKLDDLMVVADLHLGFEKSMEEEGFNIPGQTKNILEKIISSKDSCDKLLINGDIKHNIPGFTWEEYRELPKFFRTLQKHFKRIIVCKGNHDGMIERVLDFEVKREYVVGKIGFIHGHRLPSKSLVENVDVIVMGHSHPVFRFIDPISRLKKRACWVIGKPKKTFKKKFGSNVERIIVQPAFNKFFAGYSKEYFGVFNKYTKVDEILLTDMTKVV